MTKRTSDYVCQLEERVRSADRVLDAVVVPDLDRSHHLTVYVVFSAANPDSPMSSTDEWTELFDEQYSQHDPFADADFFFQGWSDSRGHNIPRNQMTEWLSATLQKLRSRYLGDVLEIGCGTGMLLLNLACDCRSYLGTDIAPAAISGLSKLIEERKLTNVIVSQRAAHEISTLAPSSIDTIIMNSVVQYFPGHDYFEEVLAQCRSLLRGTGKIFIGDIRDLRLHSAMTAWKMGFDFSTELLERYRGQVASAMGLESELLFAPSYFYLDLPGIWQEAFVTAELRRGNADNELNRYRFDVWLEAPAPTFAEMNREGCVTLIWGEERAKTVADVRELLHNQIPDELHIQLVPNLRLRYDRMTISRLVGGGLDEIPQERDKEHSLENPVHPEEFWVLAEELPGYTATVSPRCDEKAFYYDVVFVRNSSQAGFTRYGRTKAATARRTTSSTNSPRLKRQVQNLTTQLRRYMRAADLPPLNLEIIAVDQIPTSQSGAVDVPALRAKVLRCVTL